MLLLKIIVQILTGISAFFSITLDHYFEDKNTSAFKSTRKVFIILTIVLMIFGVGIISYDEYEQEKKENRLNLEITSLNESLNDSRDSIGTLIKISGKEVVDTIGKFKAAFFSFLDFAQAKYPLLSPEMAIEKLQLDLTGIKSELDNQRMNKETEDALKKTPPSIDFGLMYPTGRGLIMFVIFKNNVPIIYNFAIKEVSTGKTLASDHQLEWRLNPVSLKNNTHMVALGEFTTNVGVRTEPFKVKFTFSYESYFFKESQDWKLRGFVEKYYMIDMQKHELKEL